MSRIKSHEEAVRRLEEAVNNALMKAKERAMNKREFMRILLEEFRREIEK